MEDPQVRASIAELLAGAGLEAKDIAVESTDGGGNNRVFVVHANDAKYLAKAYYSHPADTRNRLGAEYAFLSYAWNIGLRCVPRPIFCNREKSIGLYEFVEGRKLTQTELSSGQVCQAARFFFELNTRPGRNQAGVLSTASEACFSVEQHFSVIDNRIERLRALPLQSEVDRQALSFVDDLETEWQLQKDRISREIRRSGIMASLDADDRCVSPSDFGFHNALMRSSGEICFIDFEYAGWDDPAKAIGDFFSQPKVPVSLDHFDAFIREALSYSPNAEMLAERARLLLPVFQIKWCCIILNEFLPDAAQRRRFANPTANPEFSKRMQLEKAQRFFNSITR